MEELIANVTGDVVFMIFATMAVIGGLYVIGSLFFGGGEEDAGDGEFGGEGEFGDDLSDMDDGGDVAGIFSFRNIMLFITGYGAVGAIARFQGGSFVVSSLWGVMAGVLMAAVGYFVYRFFRKQQGSSNINNLSLIGRKGIVQIPVSPETFGEVKVLDSMQRPVRLRARSSDGKTHGIGTDVTVVTVSGTEAVVKATN